MDRFLLSFRGVSGSFEPPVRSGGAFSGVLVSLESVKKLGGAWAEARGTLVVSAGSGASSEGISAALVYLVNGCCVCVVVSAI